MPSSCLQLDLFTSTSQVRPQFRFCGQTSGHTPRSTLLKYSSLRCSYLACANIHLVWPLWSMNYDSPSCFHVNRNNTTRMKRLTEWQFFCWEIERKHMFVILWPTYLLSGWQWEIDGCTLHIRPPYCIWKLSSTCNICIGNFLFHLSPSNKDRRGNIQEKDTKDTTYPENGSTNRHKWRTLNTIIR